MGVRQPLGQAVAHPQDCLDVAEMLQLPFKLSENGSITFGQAFLTMGETAFTSYKQESHLFHEPVIFKGSVYLPVIDLPNLLYGLSPGY